MENSLKSEKTKETKKENGKDKKHEARLKLSRMVVDAKIKNGEEWENWLKNNIYNKPDNYQLWLEGEMDNDSVVSLPDFLEVYEDVTNLEQNEQLNNSLSEKSNSSNNKNSSSSNSKNSNSSDSSNDEHSTEKKEIKEFIKKSISSFSDNNMKININGSKSNKIEKIEKDSFNKDNNILENIDNFDKFLHNNDIQIYSNIPVAVNSNSKCLLKKPNFWIKFLKYITEKNNNLTLFTFSNLIEQYFLWTEDLSKNDISEFKTTFLENIKKIFTLNEINNFLEMNKLKNIEDIFAKYDNNLPTKLYKEVKISQSELCKSDKKKHKKHKKNKSKNKNKKSKSKSKSKEKKRKNSEKEKEDEGD